MTAEIDFDPNKRDAIAAEMNISVLKRSDTAIKCVLKSANHVCLYQLGDDHQWRRLDVEGSLFIVERYIDHQNNPHGHKHRIVIINRKSLNNYIDDIIVGNKHLELADQMIMYSNSKQATIGMWFYQKAQADDIFEFLQRIVNGDSPQPTPEPPLPNRTPKPPAKPADQPSQKSTEQIQTTAEPAPDNSLERFFPNLKLTNGVAGHQVPESAKDSMFESQAVSTMNTSSTNIPKPATAFKPTSEIDAAIITASEIGIPESAVAESATTDVNTLASQAMQVVKGRPQLEQIRKSGARPRPSPKSTSPNTSNQRMNSHSPSKANGVAKTTSPPRSSPPSKPIPTARANVPSKGSIAAKSNPPPKQHKQPAKPSPPSKRVPGGKRGQATKGSSSTKYQGTDKCAVTSVRSAAVTTGRTEKTNFTTRPNPQFQLLTKPKKASGASEQAAETSGQVSVAAPPGLAVPTAASLPRPAVSSGDCARPSTPNVPIEKEVPGAPRAKQAKTPVRGEHAMHACSSTAPVVEEEEKGGIVKQGTRVGPEEEEARRQLRNMSMHQAQAEKVKMQEGHMFGMGQPGFGFGSGDIGLGQTGSMMGGGGSGFGGSLHAQMAMMMQQQHQMFMQQQFLAQQHQRQMQMQAGQGGQTKTKEESANDLMRMLNVERGDGKKMLDRNDDKKNVESVGESIAEAEKGGDKLDKVSFRGFLQRMLTDRRLFDSVYEHYMNCRGE